MRLAIEAHAADVEGEKIAAQMRDADHDDDRLLSRLWDCVDRAGRLDLERMNLERAELSEVGELWLAANAQGTAA